MAVAVASLIFSACATAPVKPDGAVEVRAKLTRLESNPDLATRAPEALKEAEAAVAVAEIPQTDPEIAISNVYLADRKVDIAASRAQTRFLEDQRSLIAQQRDKARLDERTREVEIGNGRLAAAHDQLADKDLQVQVARAQVGAANASAANSQAEAGAANLSAANAQADAGAARQSAANSQAEAGVARQSAANSQAEAGVARQSAANSQAEAGVARQSAANSQAELGAANLSAANAQADAGVARQSAANSQAEAGAANLTAANAQADAGVARQAAANSQAEAGAANLTAANAQADAGAARQSAANSKAEAGAANLAAANFQASAADLQRQLDELHAKPTDHGMVITLGDVMFGSSKAELRTSVVPNLDRVVAFLTRYPNRTVAIAGFTDNRGSNDYNLGLSERRANSVKVYLTQGGIDPRRITSTGMGQSGPVADNESAEGRQQNRRVEVTISNAPAASR